MNNKMYLRKLIFEHYDKELRDLQELHNREYPPSHISDPVMLFEIRLQHVVDLSSLLSQALLALKQIK